MPSADLLPHEVSSLRALFDAAWPDEDDMFTDEDWDRTFGGIHFTVEDRRKDRVARFGDRA